MGLRVPEQVSLAGFDDIEWAAFCDPPLTTVRVPAYQMGELAMKVLLDMIEKGKIEAQQYCLNTDLIIRNSCVELKNDKLGWHSQKAAQSQQELKIISNTPTRK
jgi:LacI family repressor for deo operon, udp, cdd, tsx, nupC, and nupG